MGRQLSLDLTAPTLMTRALFYVLFLFGCARGVFAEETLFSFSPTPNNSAASTRPFSTEELLIITVAGMKPGDRLTLERCGNDRCSVAAPVAEWTFENVERRGPMEVYTEGARYVFSASTDGKGIVGARSSIENGVTILHFTSGISVGVEVRTSR